MASPASVDVATNALPPGHRLHEFELRGVIGVGGFGIVYRAFDHSLQREVAIKEYLPAALAGRSSRQQVSLLSHAHADTFAVGLQSFVNEARLLARFDHPSLVKVHRFWQDNGTAYMAMPLYPGRTLRALRVAAAPDETWLRRLLEHLLGALEVMHREGVYHRDIAPDNILSSEGSAPVLLDFGAARRVISDRSQTLTAILKPSYAPIEQYAESTGLRQGPWTDFYALGATLHFLITGKPPLPATARTLSDDQPRLAGSSQGGLSDTLLQVCDWMIAPRPGDRPQNVSEIRAALAGRLPVPQRERPASDTSWRNTEIDPAAPEAPMPSRQQLLVAQRRRARAWRWAALGAIGGAALAIAAVWSLRDATSAAAQAGAADVPASARTATPVAAVAAAVTTATAATTAAAATNAAPVDAAAPVVPTTVQASVQAPAIGGGDASSRPPALDGEPRDAATPSSSADSAAVLPSPRPSPRRIEAGPAPRPAVRRAAPALAEPPSAAADAAATAPPAPAPTPPAVVAVGSPRDQCGGRHLIALHRCLVRECEKPAYQDHPQCQKVRAIEERTRRTLNAS